MSAKYSMFAVHARLLGTRTERIVTKLVFEICSITDSMGLCVARIPLDGDRATRDRCCCPGVPSPLSLSSPWKREKRRGREGEGEKKTFIVVCQSVSARPPALADTSNSRNFNVNILNESPDIIILD